MVLTDLHFGLYAEDDEQERTLWLYSYSRRQANVLDCQCRVERGVVMRMEV